VKAGRVFADGPCPCGCTVELRCAAGEDEDSGLHSTRPPPASSPPAATDHLSAIPILISKARHARNHGYLTVSRNRLESIRKCVEREIKALDSQSR
jgi:hypothetical protein